MIDREELIAVLKAVEKRLKRDGETIVVGWRNANGAPLRANVRLLRLAIEYGEQLSDGVPQSKGAAP